MKCDKRMGLYRRLVSANTPYRRRGQLLDVGINDVRNAASRYLIQQIQAEQTATAVLGEQKEWLDESWNIFPLSLENEPKSLTEKIVL